MHHEDQGTPLLEKSENLNLKTQIISLGEHFEDQRDSLATLIRYCFLREVSSGCTGLVRLARPASLAFSVATRG